ncbi:unnamed protein product [Rhizophagus irregularis]|nr:unnamed protein product [Rhizophagus irregularis]
MLTLDGKNMLSFKELFYKQFIKQRLGQQNLIRNSWKTLEEEIIENYNVNRKIKKHIFEKISEKISYNLKGENLIPSMAEPNAKKMLGAIRNSLKEDEVSYGKIVGFEMGKVNLTHYQVLSDPEDLNMVFKKCMGCNIDDRTILERPNYKKEPCVFSANEKTAFFLENQKFTTSKPLILNQAYIIPDITQHHFELKIRYNNYFINNPNNFVPDDSRLGNQLVSIQNCENQNIKKNLIRKYVLKDLGNNNLALEKLLVINNKLEKFKDSETICKRFEDVKKAYNFVNARKIYKEQNNIYFWALIRTLLKDEKIFIPKMVKVRAHSDNIYHNTLDASIKRHFEDLNKTYVFGKLLVDDSDLTFIDIIKGIFPLDLSDYLSKTVKMSKNDRIKVSKLFLNFIYDETKLIWNERCELQNKKKKSLRLAEIKNCWRIVLVIDIQ